MRVYPYPHSRVGVYVGSDIPYPDPYPSNPYPCTRTGFQTLADHYSFLELLNLIPSKSPTDHTRQHLSLLELLNLMPDDFASPLDELDTAECAAENHALEDGMEDDNGSVHAASDASVIRMDVDSGENIPSSPKVECAWEGGPKRK